MWSDTILLSLLTVLYCSVLYGEHECQYCLFVHLIVGVCLFKLRAVRIWSWTLGKAKGGMVVGVGGGSSCWAGAPWVATPGGGSRERKYNTQFAKLFVYLKHHEAELN